MAGEYDRYNQAITSDSELKKIEQEAQTQFNTEYSKLSSARSELNSAEQNIQKQLRSATLQNQQYDINQVKKARSEISSQRGMLAGAEQDLRDSLKPIEQERAKINAAKTSIQTPEKLEAQGYQKEVRGDQIIYFKEDTYKDGKKTKSFREEEYIFSNSGTPIKFIERDTLKRNDGDRDIYDQEVTEFQNGLVTRYTQKEAVDGDDEYKRREFYDSKGRIDEIKTYDDGKFKEEKNYRYNDSTGQVTIETDTAAAKASRKSAKEAESKFWNEWNKAYNTAKSQGINISVDADRFKTLDAKAKEFNRQYEKGVQDLNSVTEVRLSTKNNPKSDVETTKFFNKFGDLLKTETQTTNYFTADEVAMKASLSPEYYKNKDVMQTLSSGSGNNNPLNLDPKTLNLDAGIPGVNQGTDTSNLPIIDLKLDSPTQNFNMIGPPRMPTQQDINYAIEYENAGPVKKFFMKDWTAETDKYWERQNRASSQGTNDYDAVLLAMGTGVLSGAQKTGQAVRTIFTQNPLTTISNVVTSIPEIPGNIKNRAQANPPGFIGEVFFDVVGTKGATEGFSAIKNSIRPATIIENPVNVQTTLIDDTIKAESVGNFQIESGLIKRTKKDFSFESTGNLQRVKSFDVADVGAPNQLRLTQDTIKLLKDSPETIKFTQTSTELSPFVRSQSAKGSSSTIAESPISKEVFRGEIETKIKNAQGEVIRVEKQPAELIRSGLDQTLFIDGKPFSIKNEIIDTPKGIGVIELDKKITGFTEEGAYGLDPKRQTIQSTITDPLGNQKVSLTQKELAADEFLFPQSGDFSYQFKQISAEQKKLLSNAPFNDVFDSSSRALADPLFQAKKTRARSPKTPGLSDDTQIFSGVSFNAEKEALSVTKAEKNIIEGVITGEKDLPKSLGFEQPKLGYKETKVLESAAASEERLFREVFGNDFVDTAKKTKTIDLDSNPFDDFKAPNFDQTMAFKAQETKFKSTTDLFKEKPAAPTSRGSSQETIFMEQPKQAPKSAKPNEINVKDAGFNPAMGVDFSKTNMPKSPRYGFLGAAISGFNIPMPGFAQPQASGSSQGFIPGLDMGKDGAFISKQISGQGFKPAVDLGFIPGMAQGKIMETAQQTSQDLAFNIPGAPPVTIPGFPTNPPGVPPKPPKAGSSKSAQKQSSTRKKPTLDGEYIGSLTGALLGRKTKKDLKNLTGLEIRPIKIRGKK